MATRRRSGNGAANLPTIGDVARLAGVSKATASRALAGSRDRVSDALTARVRRAAAELNYVVNRTARALARSTSDTIGLIVHDVSDPYFGEIARGVLAAAGADDRFVVICNTFRDPVSEARYVAELRAQRVGAVILAGSSYVEPEAAAALRGELEQTAHAGARVVVLAPHGSGRAVLPDNRGGGALAAEHLATLGHHRVAIAAGPAHLTTIHHRLDGFLGRWRAAGRPEPRVTYTSFDREGGRAAVADLDLTEITALFALNDLMAIGMMHELSVRGCEPGRDVSVVGFDDIPLAADVSPGLTTIRVPMEELGRRAVAALSEEPDVEPETLACELVVRGTTGPGRAVNPTDEPIATRQG
jgi:LacI family transcriptional regulator